MCISRHSKNIHVYIYIYIYMHALYLLPVADASKLALGASRANEDLLSVESPLDRHESGTRHLSAPKRGTTDGNVTSL